jgi:hypothetical protein
MEKSIKFRKLTITEADREFSTTIEEDQFTIKIPLPLERSQIIARIARATGGLPVSSMTPEDYEYMKMIITLNQVIVKHPDYWEGADACPDDGLLWKLYQHYLDSELKFQENLKKNSSAQKLTEQ